MRLLASIKQHILWIKMELIIFLTVISIAVASIAMYAVTHPT
jgi:hypothetical protein